MRILLIDDNVDVCDAIRSLLENEGYNVDVCQDCEEALLWVTRQAHDIVLLERTLSRGDGVAILKEAREQGVNTPFMILSAQGEPSDVISGLNAGADDYLAKPYDPGVLLARIRALSRRPKSWQPDFVVAYKEMRLNLKARSLEWRGKVCELTKRETTLFEILMKNKGSVVARDEVFAYIWGSDANVDERILNSYVRRGRIRLREIECPIGIKTIRYTGICLKE